MDKKLITIGEATKLLGISIDTLRKWDKNNILLSFRPNPSGHRHYRPEDIENFLKKNHKAEEKNLINLAKEWAMNNSQIQISPQFYCETSDLFSARLQNFNMQLEKKPELKTIFPLITAIVGEIGNNSYDHNIGNWPDVPGTFFAYDITQRLIILADRGQGILKTLKKVIPDLKTDAEALKIAFTEYISARAPEYKGNGLKFVKDVVSTNPFQLKFHTGNAEIELNQNSKKLDIKTTATQFHGCIAILHY